MPANGTTVVVNVQQPAAPAEQDGLYWQTEGEAELSPLGPLVAEADAYTKDYYKRGEPYHGYYFKILTRRATTSPAASTTMSSTVT